MDVEEAMSGGHKEEAKPRAAAAGEEDEGEDKKKTTTTAAKRKRGRVEMRRIEDRVSRQVRFSKRRKGLFNKAFQLSELCDAQIALLVFSPAGRLYEFASSNSSIGIIFGRYWDLANTVNDLNIEARDSWFNCNNNMKKDKSAASSLYDQLNNIAQWALESNIKGMSLAELRRVEETVTDALTIIKNKLMMKETGLPPPTRGKEGNSEHNGTKN